MKRIILLLLAYLCSPNSSDCIKKDCLCVDSNLADTIESNCTNKNALHCYSDYHAICRKDLNEKCNWYYNKFLLNCLTNENFCLIGGCNKEVCGQNYGEEIVSSCVYKPMYKCYREAKCEVQFDGFCDWTLTRRLERCLSFYH